MTPPTPKCPMCGHNKKVAPMKDGMFRCNQCKGLFDDNPNEGGVSLNNDPERAYELKHGDKSLIKGRRIVRGMR